MRRNLVSFIHKYYDTKKDNYYKANKMYFNVYKTDSTYGMQVLDVSNVILKKWIKMSKNDYMLYSSNGNKLSSPRITRILNKVFDKKFLQVCCDISNKCI